MPKKNFALSAACQILLRKDFAPLKFLPKKVGKLKLARSSNAFNVNISGAINHLSSSVCLQ